MRLPDIQRRLREIATEAGLPELRFLADEMRRRPSQKAPISSEPMTDELRDAIRAFARRHQHMTQVDIGRHFNVNQGRVSEALKGFRT